MTDLLKKDKETLTIFEFSLGDESYGISTKYISEILEYKNNTPVPNTPESIEGIFILRGKVIVNLNLFKCLNLDYNYDEESKRAKNIIIEFRKADIGLIVSSVNGIHRVSSDDILEVDKKNKNEFVIATIKKNNKQITLLDVEKIIHSVNDNV